VRTMDARDLDVAIGWAAGEGWNPGHEDAAAFLQADPTGFLMGWLGAEPVSAISVVRHAAGFGFLGLYLVAPGKRGRGFGLATWQAGMAYLGARVVGLDGVPAQQENYRRSGFALVHQTQRHRGAIRGAPDPAVRDATLEDLPALRALDRDIGGIEHPLYLDAWFRPAATRHTMLLAEGGSVRALGTIRACREGHKIGPLLAPDAPTAERMLRALVARAGARQVMVDIPDPNTAGVAMARALGLTPMFACARMYKGAPPVRDLTRLFGETTFELG
ncbi:MAG: GNAT family N-acetyltransferase, partial [Pseudomonadota bacterium]